MKTKTIATLMMTLFLMSVLAAASPAFAKKGGGGGGDEIESQGGDLRWILDYSSFKEVREISFEAEVRGTSEWGKLKIKAITSTGEKIELKAEWIITEELDPGTELVYYYNGKGTAIVKINRVETPYTLETVRFASTDYTDLHIAGGSLEDSDDVFRVSWSEVTKNSGVFAPPP